MSNHKGRNVALVAVASLASVVMMFAGANPAGAPEIDELISDSAAVETQDGAASLDSQVATAATSYDVELATATDLEAAIALPSLRDLEQIELTEVIAEPVMPTGEQITAIGDSLMVGATPFMEELLPGVSIDGRVGRPMPEGMNILNELLAQDNVGDYVVLGLATNAGVTVSQFDAIIEAIGPDRTVVMVNAYGDRSWIPGGNDQVEAAAAKYPGQIVVADWNGLIGEHPEYIGPDGIHANNAGKAAYAQLVLETLETAAGVR